jgi:CRP/FNR family cyclic AMP-dependent transcriptional regulator
MECMSTAPPNEIHFEPEEVIFHEGDVSDSLFLIKNGSVSIRKRKGNGYIELSSLHSNEVFGELSFFDRKPRSATAVAITAVDVLEIKFDSLDAQYMKIPDYLRTIMAALADRLRKADAFIHRLQNELVDEGSSKESPADSKKKL